MKTTASVLIENGGREWKKGNYHRIYFDISTMSELYGLKYSTYGTGSISSAYLNGDKISNSEAYRIISSLRDIYYDVLTEKFNTPNNSHCMKIVDILKSKIQECI